MISAAIGFRVHSGWASLVAVAGSPASPAVLDRRRIEIADRAIAGSSQPFHKAKDLGLSKSQAYLDRCADAAQELAKSALQKAISDLAGHNVAGCAILLASGRPAQSLEATLASHAAIHTAEGEWFREVLACAVADCGLRCEKIREKELRDAAASAFSIKDFDGWLQKIGKPLGPPWRKDEKYAAVAGWLVLHA